MKRVSICICIILLLINVFSLVSYAVNDYTSETTPDISTIDKYRYEVSSLSSGHSYFERNQTNRSISQYYVETPNGTPISVFCGTCSHTQNTIDEINMRWDGLFPQALRHSSADCTYNCHSYAWYNQDPGDNYYWMDNPSAYYQDDSYIEVAIPRKGDIVCYFDDMGTISQSDDVNRHSGIVIEYDSSIVSNNICGIANQIVVLSKWGQAGLYEHQGDYCPYISIYGGNADYVKFYRPRSDSTHQLAEDMSAFALSETLTHTGEITDRYVMYEFDVEDKIPYLITVTSNISTNDRFYDSSMNYQNVSGFDMGNGKYGYIYTFDIGINYFRIENVNSSAEANLVVHVYAHNGHNFCNVLSLGDTYHTYSCPCGETSGTQELHRWRDYSLTHVVCEDCGLLKRLPPEGFTPIIKGITPDTETE